MEQDPLSRLKSRIISLGLFLLFVVEFGEFVVRKVWHVVGPVLR